MKSLMIRKTPNASKVTRGTAVLYDALSAASLVLTGSAPSEQFRCAVTLSAATGHTDCAGSVTINGEAIPFTAAGRKTSSAMLTTIPTITTTGLDCQVKIECIDQQGAPIIAEVLTDIAIKLEAHSSGYRDGHGVWQATKSRIFTRAQLVEEDVIRYRGTDYTVKSVDSYEYKGQELYRTLLVN